jgi:hypothetical protein
MKKTVCLSLSETLIAAIDKTRPAVISRSAAVEDLITRGLEKPNEGHGGSSRG